MVLIKTIVLTAVLAKQITCSVSKIYLYQTNTERSRREEVPKVVLEEELIHSII